MNKSRFGVDLFASDKTDYLEKYNNILSKAAAELDDNFAVIANPTLSKQETVTNLHSYVCSQTDSSKTSTFPWNGLVEFLPRLVLSFFKLAYTCLRFRVKELPQNSIYFRTWLVPRSIQGQELVDDYFRTLPDDLSRDNKIIVSFYPLDYSLLKKIKKLNKKENYIVAVGLLSIFDIIKLVLDYIFTAHLKVKGSYTYKGRDIAPAINRSLWLDYFQLRSFQAYQDKYICQKLLRFNLKAFVYVFENQSWEKACCSIFKGKDTRLVSYQSSGFSPVFLNFFPTELDASKHPMPDIILTVGDLYTKYLLAHGHFKIPVRTFAALRFSHPNDGVRYTVLEPNPKILKKIMYAFPVQFSQYQNIIRDLIKVFEGTSITLDLKFHPIIKQKKINTFIPLPGNFNIIDQIDMNSLSESYDFVLFNDNSFGIESLLMGVRSYQYDATNRFDDERFFYFKLWDTHLGYDGLLLLRDSLLNGSYNKKYEVSAVSDYVNSMYRPYATNPELFFELINTEWCDDNIVSAK